MKIIDYLKEKFMDLPLEAKGRIFTIGIFIFALMVSGILYKSQTSTLELLTARKDAEIKKNTTLNKIKQLEKTIGSYAGLLPKEDPSLIANTISNIAKESGVEIISLEPGRGEKEKLYIRYPFTANLQAVSYHAIAKFISKLEGRIGLYSVEAIGISLSGIDTPADKLTVNLTFNIIAFTG